MKTHLVSGSELGPAHSNGDPEFSVNRPANTSRTKSVPSSALPQRPSSFISHGDYERKSSNADSTFPGEDRYPRSQPVESSDSLGLHIIHDPEEPECDVIFVHGLGGTAHQTWSWNRDLTHFWPAWLACEHGLSSVRTLTFGYNSNFKGVATKLNITDFAKELLFHMLVFAQGVGGSFGTRPIIFVAHSMGGLVVKKAYILGKHDCTYSTVISQTYGILFLGTPHRGAHHAKILNTILSTTPLGAPPKAYIADLETSSPALQDINEQFRSVCESLMLASFFETLKINFGMTKVLIVERESSILGYPHELSQPLNADHHSICKYQSRNDGNYISVRDTLKLWASRLGLKSLKSMASRRATNDEWLKSLESILGIRESAELELNTQRNKVLDGTCKWITQRKELREWIRSSQKHDDQSVFWLVGLPATGKTVLASVIIDHLQFLGEQCQYHFFLSGHQMRRTASYCLRSIALQIAQVNDDFREKLIRWNEDSGMYFNSQHQVFKVIWENLFEGILFKMKFHKPLFWVFDAIDEVDSSSLLLDHLLKIRRSLPIRILLTSRPMKIRTATYTSNIVTYFLSERDTEEDIRTYIQRFVSEALPDDNQIQKEVTQQVLQKASGCFLWVKLALDVLQSSWHTQDDIKRALTDVPHGMEQMYDHMLARIRRQSPRYQAIASRILTWAVCSWRPLTIAELEIVLHPEFTGFLSLEETVVEICAHFISVDVTKVSIIHATAHDFLLRNNIKGGTFVDSRLGHQHLAIVCLQHLCSDSWRRVLKQAEQSTEIDSISSAAPRKNGLLVAEEGHPFFGYATCYWAYHVSKSALDSQVLTDTLRVFFDKYCLTWIESIALSGNLRYLIRTAQYLKAFSKRISRKPGLGTNAYPISLKEPPENELEVHLWAIDFTRIAGKFGVNLLQKPSAIFKLIPPFCPPSSKIGEAYRNQKSVRMLVSGLSTSGWNDCLANVSVKGNETANRVLASDMYFLILVSVDGIIVVWFSETCEEVRRMHHNEYVSLIVLNDYGTLVASAGIQTYRVWDIASGEEMYRLPKWSPALTMSIAFGKIDSDLLIGLADCSITYYDLLSMQVIWSFMPEIPDRLKGCPRMMAFSPDQSKVAMAWRGNPPLLWDLSLSQNQHPEMCPILSKMDATNAICSPESIKWRDSSSLLVLCHDTRIFEWQIYDENLLGFDHVMAREMTVSQDGNFLLTSDNTGTISIWTFPRLSLIYRLINENEFVRSLAFSPDSQRFYDTRGSNCNVWEPDALVRPDERDVEDQSSVGDISAYTEAVIKEDESSKCQITALSCNGQDKYYCCGREDGAVLIHDAFEGNKVRKVYSHASTSSVILLNWSNSGKYIVSSDDSGRVIVKRLETKEVGKWAVFPVLDIRFREPVQQFHFNESEKLLLICTSSVDQVWELKRKKQLCQRQWDLRKYRRWINHPFNNELLIWIDPHTIRFFSWISLECSGLKNDAQPLVSLHSSNSPTPVSSSAPELETLVSTSPEERIVQWVALTQDKRHIIYETLPNTGHASTRSEGGLHLELISTSSLQMQYPHSTTSDCLADLEGEVKRLIGIFQDRIVFLDHNYWICSWKVDSSVGDVRRHFFLPKDWLHASTLQMALLNSMGTIFCPKYEGVAIVRNGLGL